MKSQNVISGKAKYLSPAVRKACVLVMYGSGLAFAVVWHYSRLQHSNALGMGAIGLLLSALAAFGILFTGTSYWDWSHNSDPQLDERQRATRNQAYRLAFSTYSTLTFAGLVYCSIAADANFPMPSWEIDGQWLVWGSLLFALTLPGAVLAWIDRPIVDE